MANQFGYGKIITDGLVLCFDSFDNNCYSGSGTVIKDLSNPNITWNMTTATYNTSSKSFNYANSSTAKYIQTSSSFALTSDTSALTFEYFCRFNTSSLSTYPSLFFDRGQGTTPFIWIYIGSNLHSLYIQYSIGSSYTYSNANNVFTGYYDTWVHLVLSVQYGQSGANVKIYRNTTSLLNSNIARADFPSEVTTKNIGCYSNYAGHNWTGDIAVMRLYNRILTQYEIQQNFNTQRSRFNI